MMKKNMGFVDKFVRVLAAVIIAVLYLTHVISGLLALILLIIGIIFIVTSLLGFCPMYLPFHINTGKKKE
jgi:hypothetical protein